MLRIFGYLLPQNKIVSAALTKIFGIGKKLSLVYLQQLNINSKLKISDLNLEDLQKLYNYIEKQTLLETNLKKFINNNIDRLKFIKSYRGSRHINSLPLRGQRTKTNAQTRKKKRNFILINKNAKVWKKQKSKK